MGDAVSHITSRENPVLVQVRKLVHQAAGSRRAGLCWIEGEHLCRAAIEAGMVPTNALLSVDAWAAPSLRALAVRADKVGVVPEPMMAGLTSLESPAPIGFLIRIPADPEVDAQAPTLVLDRVQDPGNVGSMLRSASAFGFRQVIAMQGSVALWSPKVMRGGMGAHFSMRLVERADMRMLQRLAVPWLGTSSHAHVVLGSGPLPWPCAWLVGHEGQGIDAALLAACTHVFRIRQPGGEESLNVAVAAAICMHASVRECPSATDT